MFKKSLPSDERIEDLAAQLRMLRKPGQTIRPFLRKNAQLFRDLLDDDWSWAGIALAMTKAGIKYETGNVLSANLLMQAYSRAQLPLKGYARRKGQNTPLDSNIAEPAEGKPKISIETPSGISPALAASRAIETVETDQSRHTQHQVIPDVSTQPKFKAFSVKSQEPPREPTPDEIKDRDAIRKRMFGN